MEGTIHSYLPQERRDAAGQALEAARAELTLWQRAWAERVPGEEDDYLRDRRDGARAGVRTWERYIKAGCRRVDGTV